MFDQQKEDAEEFVIKVFRLLQEENPEYHIAFIAFMTLAITVANEMGMDKSQFLEYCSNGFENDRKFVISELQ